MIFRNRDGTHAPIAIGARVQRGDRPLVTRIGTVLAVVEPRALEPVARALVRWDNADHAIELWPLASLIVADEETGAHERS